MGHGAGGRSGPESPCRGLTEQALTPGNILRSQVGGQPPKEPAGSFTRAKQAHEHRRCPEECSRRKQTEGLPQPGHVSIKLTSQSGSVLAQSFIGVDPLLEALCGGVTLTLYLPPKGEC